MKILPVSWIVPQKSRTAGTWIYPVASAETPKQRDERLNQTEKLRFPVYATVGQALFSRVRVETARLTFKCGLKNLISLIFSHSSLKRLIFRA
ncbi:MAG: hypothetical protein WCV67_06010 [Victivallaceae bacterium]